MRTIKPKPARGSQLVEMALVLPMLLLLALLVGEGARVIRAHIVINNAAREGAHLASLGPNNCAIAPSPGTCISAIRTTVIAYAANNGITLTAGNVAVNQGMTIPAAPVAFNGSQVTVTYAYPLTYLPPFVGAFFGPTAPTVTLLGQAEFRNMY